MTDILREYFTDDSMKVLDAKFEAQKIAFAPYAFQAAMALRNMGILEVLYQRKNAGATIGEIALQVDIGEYGIGVLLEFGLGIGLVKLKPETEEPTYLLGKVGYFVLNDEMTRVNMDFMNDICYDGAASMEDSIRNGKPEGLSSLGDWSTIYEGLSILPEKPKKSWFAFDHFYSDNAFPEALPEIFHRPVKNIMDIGGNTAKWALSCTEYDSDVQVTIVDLPGQCGMARKNIDAAGMADRIHTHPQNVLEKDAVFPEGHDVVWMSQFLDCFGTEEITDILTKVRRSIDDEAEVFILEPLWDQQNYKAAAYSLNATSLYFTVMANGNSKMYSRRELVAAVEKAGFRIDGENHDIGPNEYSLLRFRKALR